MIPATYPSVLDSNNRTKMLVYQVPSITGLTRWVDYIPVKSPANESDLSLANTFANAGFILSNSLSSVEGLQAFVDYIPIYVDNNATVPWSTDANGYIPLSDLFSIPALFASGEQGAWYDPSDINSYMSGLGSELITNGDFSNGTTGWLAAAVDSTVGGATISVTNGVFRVTNDATGVNYGLGSQAISCVVGKTYVVTLNRVGQSITTTPAKWHVGTAPNGAIPATNILANQVNSTATFVATSTTVYINLGAYENNANAWAEWDNISVKEVTSISNATMFQDAAGTTPVTTVEQPVGLVLDKRLGSAVIGTELVSNNTFASDTVWTKGAGWTIGSGVATKTAGTASVLSQTISITSGKTYRVVYTITRTAGTITPRFTGGTTVTGTARSASGTYVDFFTAISNTAVDFSADATFAGTVDNVYVKQVTGNDACQPTSASRPTLSARYNLLTYSEQFDNATWTKTNASISANSTTDPNGTNTAEKLVATTTSGVHSVTQSFTPALGVTYTASFYVKKGEYNWCAIELGGASLICSAYFDLENGVPGVTVNSPTPSITPLGNGWFKCSITKTSSGTSPSYSAIYACTANNTASFAGDNTSGIYIWGADLRVANDGVGLPDYQRVTASTDYDTTGFPPYLSFDGTDDHLYAQPVNLSGGDNALIVAGQRKLKDGTAGPLALSSTATSPPNGHFILYCPSALNSYRLTNRGTITANAGNGTFATSPHTGVVTGAASISGDFCRLRLNGSTIETVTTDQGTGNYASTSQFQIGKQSTAFFQGRLYNLVIRMAASTDAQIANTEAFVNTKTKAY